METDSQTYKLQMQIEKKTRVSCIIRHADLHYTFFLICNFSAHLSEPADFNKQVLARHVTGNKCILSIPEVIYLLPVTYARGTFELFAINKTKYHEMLSLNINHVKSICRLLWFVWSRGIDILC